MFVSIFSLDLYGSNKIEVEIKSYWQLFMEEIFTPFYFFQAFSILLWSFDDYMLYALCVLFLTLFSSITALLQTRKVRYQNYFLLKNIKNISFSKVKNYTSWSNLPVAKKSTSYVTISFPENQKQLILPNWYPEI